MTKWVISIRLSHSQNDMVRMRYIIFITESIHCNWIEWIEVENRGKRLLPLLFVLMLPPSLERILIALVWQKETIIYIRMDNKSSEESRDIQKDRKKCRNFSVNLASFIAQLPLFFFSLKKPLCLTKCFALIIFLCERDI